MVAEGTAGLSYDATITHADVSAEGTRFDPDAAADKTAAKIRALNWPIAAVLAGAETGVLLADQLAVRGPGEVLGGHGGLGANTIPPGWALPLSLILSSSLATWRVARSPPDGP